MAEVMEGRRDQFVDEVVAGEGLTRPRRAGRRRRGDRPAASGTPAGPTRSAQVVGGTNPVAGPYFDFSMPEPTGVVAVLAPQESSLLGLVSVVAPVIVTGNTGRRGLVARPAVAGDHAVGGAGHLRRAGRRRQHAHRVGGRYRPDGSPRTWTSTRIDLTGAAGDPEHAVELEVAAADNLKRVRRAPAAEPDWSADPGIGRLTQFLETKTVWHPIGV